MPSHSLHYIEKLPMHIVMHGHNHHSLFINSGDYEKMYECLHKASNACGIHVHAWVLLHDHIHLLATPGNKQNLVKAIGLIRSRYTDYYKMNYLIRDSLWEEGYNSCFVEVDSYLLSSYLYIEQKPVRKGVVDAVDAYQYSSYPGNALGHNDALITPHPLFLETIANLSDCESGSRYDRTRYQMLHIHPVNRYRLEMIRHGITTNSAVGAMTFIARVARMKSLWRDHQV